MKQKILLSVSRFSFLAGALLLVLGLLLGTLSSPAMAQTPDGSVLAINSGCSGDCSSINIEVCNIGSQNMTETPVYNIWFVESGEPKFGTVVFSGNIPALTSGSCTSLAYIPTASGNYQFQVYQPSGYSGQGDLWSSVCEVNCQIPTEVPTEIPTEVPTEIPTDIPTQIPTEQPTVEPLIIMLSPACVAHEVEWSIQNMNYSDVEFYFGIDLPEPVSIPVGVPDQPLTVAGNQSLVFLTSGDGPHRVTLFWYEGETISTLSSFISAGFCPEDITTQEPTAAPPGVIIPPLEIPVTGSDNVPQTQVLIPVTGGDNPASLSLEKGYTDRLIINFGLVFFGIGIVCQGVNKKYFGR